MNVICDVIQRVVYSLHYNRELWDLEDSQEFIPQRHYTLEIKLCLAHLLSQYIIQFGDKTDNNFIIRETLVIQPDAVYIKLNPNQWKFFLNFDSLLPIIK
ncbi:unnamed protein product [Rotaria sp. Silwood1]|nr:unnamed protein product [Rotaria sp. Silwood1]CAF3630244.1 unnamed protein product [Rotaria sp. Silwood1]CAF3665141.1 unnamed protein product [Rotaria sp. Silwood1]